MLLHAKMLQGEESKWRSKDQGAKSPYTQTWRAVGAIDRNGETWWALKPLELYVRYFTDLFDHIIMVKTCIKTSTPLKEHSASNNSQSIRSTPALPLRL